MLSSILVSESNLSSFSFLVLELFYGLSESIIVTNESNYCAP